MTNKIRQLHASTSKKIEPGPDESDWTDYLERDTRGRPLSNLANATAALRRAPQLKELFYYDEMLSTVVVALPRDAALEPDLAAPRRLLRDVDVHRTQEWLQRNGLAHVGRETVQQAIETIADERKIHPIQIFLRGLRWDRKSRLESWLPRYLGTDDTEYARTIGRLFLIQMVARAMQPGCKADHVLILEGAQGAGKSQACRILGGSYFSESLPPIGSGKDVAQHLRGKWVIEISELAASRKAHSANLKAFLTQVEERYRPSYGRNEVVEQRQCVFIGTTNDAAYLRDETGGRRFWPVKVGNIDLQTLQEDRDQLLAEAYHRLVAGEPWWPEAQFEASIVRPQQDERFDVDPWQDIIANAVRDLDCVTIGSLVRNTLHIETPRLSKRDSNRVAAILIALGWERGKKNGDGLLPYVRRA